MDVVHSFLLLSHPTKPIAGHPVGFFAAIQSSTILIVFTVFAIEVIEINRVRRWAPYENCTAPSVLHFPYLGLPDGLQGAVLPTIVLVYFLQAFTLLCSKYFFPALSDISDRFSSEVARSTVMSAVATMPELAVSVIGTFFTEEDVGASAIVGSAVFNTLVIPGVCALIAGGCERNSVDVWALSRDSFMYGLSLLCLAIFFQGDVIQWYEALTMIILYSVYLGGIQIDKFLKRRTTSIYYKVREDIFENSPLSKIGGKTCYGGSPEFYSSCDEVIGRDEIDHQFMRSENKSWYGNINYYFIWPTAQTMKYSIPSGNPWFSLLSCCMWISAISYIISWTVAVVGYKLRIPDSLMGLTVLGMGVGIPELIISLAVVKKGKGTMALCNALGSNIINILLCLGLPWLLKMAVSGKHGISFNTDGLSYNCFLILLMVILLYLAMMINNFVLDKKIGCFLLTSYGIFFISTVLIELNVFFKANLPMCNIKDYFID